MNKSHRTLSPHQQENSKPKKIHSIHNFLYITLLPKNTKKMKKRKTEVKTKINSLGVSPWVVWVGNKNIKTGQ